MRAPAFLTFILPVLLATAFEAQDSAPVTGIGRDTNGVHFGLEEAF